MHLLVMTYGELGDDGRNLREDEQQRAFALLGAAGLHWGGFPDGAVPGGRATVRRIEEVVAGTSPDLVYGHVQHDTHQDHRETSAATLSGCRRVRSVLLYETLTTTRSFSPTVYVDVAPAVSGKLALLRCHTSQMRAGRVRLDIAKARAAVRGGEAQVRAAEAFQAERYVVPF